MNTPDTEWEKEEWGAWKFVSEMLDNPDEHGIYQTSKCYKQIYDFVVAQKEKALTSRDTYWKERVDRAFVILDTNIQELVTYEEGRVSKGSVLTCVRRIKRELDNLK